LLIDDTWMTGGNAQSAALALRAAGAAKVAIVVMDASVIKLAVPGVSRLRAAARFAGVTGAPPVLRARLP
jgi:phosphoribosylpyrophosphate synthetase